MIHDFENNLKDLKYYKQDVILDPARWSGFASPVQLNWRSVRFDAENRNHIPHERGIYAFVVQFQDHQASPLPLPIHGYVMYAGITGHRSADRTLNDRFGDYLRDQKRPKRMSIYSMLNKWAGHLFFHFSTVGPEVQLDTLETTLNDAIIPPYVTNDFTAEVRALVRTLRTN